MLIDGVGRRAAATGGGLRARLGGRGDAGGNAGSLGLVAVGKAGEVGAGEADVEVVGVVKVISVADVLNEVDIGETGPERTSVGGIDESVGGMVGEEGSGMRRGEVG